jgi:hypothetical protein
VRDDVAVRVAGKPALAGKPDAAEHERHTLDEGVRVDAETDSELAQESDS